MMKLTWRLLHCMPPGHRGPPVGEHWPFFARPLALGSHTRMSKTSGELMPQASKAYRYFIRILSCADWPGYLIRGSMSGDNLHLPISPVPHTWIRLSEQLISCAKTWSWRALRLGNVQEYIYRKQVALASQCHHWLKEEWIGNTRLLFIIHNQSNWDKIGSSK